MGNEYRYEDERHPWWMVPIKLIFWIFTLGFILVAIGWFFNLSSRGKRNFFIVVAIIIVMSYLWEWFLDVVPG